MGLALVVGKPVRGVLPCFPEPAIGERTASFRAGILGLFIPDVASDHETCGARAPSRAMRSSSCAVPLLHSGDAFGFNQRVDSIGSTKFEVLWLPRGAEPVRFQCHLVCRFPNMFVGGWGWRGGRQVAACELGVPENSFEGFPRVAEPF